MKAASTKDGGGGEFPFILPKKDSFYSSFKFHAKQKCKLDLRALFENGGLFAWCGAKIRKVCCLSKNINHHMTYYMGHIVDVWQPSRLTTFAILKRKWKELVSCSNETLLFGTVEGRRADQSRLEFCFSVDDYLLLSIWI